MTENKTHSPDTARDELRALLFQLEAELKVALLWQSEPLPPDAYESKEPFGIDRMSFAQWLQFIFVPRMQALLDAGQPLPSPISISPLAETYFEQVKVADDTLLSVIRSIEQWVLHC